MCERNELQMPVDQGPPTSTGIGQTTITGKNQVSLPADGLRRLGWHRGDHLVVDVLGDDVMVLIKRPASWTEAFAGRLGHVFGGHPQNLAYLEEERRGWDLPGGDRSPR